MDTRGRSSRSALNSPSIDTDTVADDATALDRMLRALYASYEALRDDSASAPAASAPLAALLRAPNWWRAAQQQLAAARAALSESNQLAAGMYAEREAVTALARALSATLLAAVLLRLPYDAWRPDVVLQGGWQPADGTPSALSSPSAEWIALLAEIGVRCRLARRSPRSLVAVCRQALTA